MSMKNRKVSLLIISLLVLALSAGCTTVNKEHPLVVSKEIKAGDATNFATVYFIRPRPYKSKGVADKTVYVKFQEKTLLSIDEGSYTLLRIKPSKGQVKVFNETKFINKSTPIKVWRARQYKFIEGKTYFIHLRRIDEEYRGVFYEPEPVKLQKAKVLIDKARASGAAQNAPIEKLTEVSEPPASATESLTPALPENIYNRESYLK